jgi:hypothetical protein
VGKTTLMSEVATFLRNNDVPVLEVCEDALWGKRQLGWDPVELTGVWPEFRELLHEPLPRGSITSANVLNTFQRIRDRAAQSGAVWIQDWSWLDLTILLWPKADKRKVARFTDDLRTLAEPLRPAVLYLRTNPESALRRAVAERGEVWLERHAANRVSAPTHNERLVALAAFYGRREHFRRRVLQNSGWTLVCLDADDSRQEVLRAALIALGLRT